MKFGKLTHAQAQSTSLMSEKSSVVNCLFQQLIFVADDDDDDSAAASKARDEEAMYPPMTPPMILSGRSRMERLLVAVLLRFFAPNLVNILL